MNRMDRYEHNLLDIIIAGVTQVITPITVTRSLPLVTQMAVMQPAKHVAHVITASAMDKVANHSTNVHYIPHWLIRMLICLSQLSLYMFHTNL